MPWFVRRTVYLILVGAAVAALSIFVYVANDGAVFDVLATIGLLGGVAIVINTLPTNGHDRHDGGPGDD